MALEGVFSVGGGRVTVPSVAVIVLNWNGLEDTSACLASLGRVDYPSFRVVVVDNGSTDGSPARLLERFPNVTLIELERNLGYAGGNNAGLRHAIEMGVDYALLLNNDTEVAPEFLRQLVETAEADPRVGMVGPTIYYYDHPDVIWSAGGAIDWRRGKTWMVCLNEPDRGQCGTEPRIVDFVTGCAMLVRREVMERVGLLDERFFLYYEEVEWCTRARRAGFKVLHLPAAHVWHKIPLDARGDSPEVHYYMTRNRLLFLRLAGVGWRAWAHTLLREYARTLLAWSLRPRWRDKAPQRRAMVEAILDAGRARWGRRSGWR